MHTLAADQERIEFIGNKFLQIPSEVVEAELQNFQEQAGDIYNSVRQYINQQLQETQEYIQSHTFDEIIIRFQEAQKDNRIQEQILIAQAIADSGNLDNIACIFHRSFKNSEAEMILAKAIVASGNWETIIGAWEIISEDSRSEKVLREGMTEPAKIIATSNSASKIMNAWEESPIGSEAEMILTKALVVHCNLNSIISAFKQSLENLEVAKILAQAISDSGYLGAIEKALDVLEQLSYQSSKAWIILTQAKTALTFRESMQAIIAQ